ncbi:MAG: protoporphyrinogen oxidase [Meiothermus sp.]|uniref:Protoporphyrinogen oxidase n=1 Tax=Meiothermus hypogaeus TaxID=884155 RepID=A0ABX9MN03_9DEIN|nr:FAD-dependent oxidoreductase [Meiothermus hypogaeus]RIH77160.1 Protoporphyrinogen oxidase [Meiothermus hypogaeus]GIW37985.1 MAG: protoporphyrinogen oxidase [Meiothermus sp.]
MSRIIVIGGGLAGLTAAYWAVEAGLEVSLLEATHRFGGHTRTAKLDAIALELGEEFFEDTPDTLLNLCGLLGLEPQPLPDLRRVVRQGGQDWVLPAGLNLASGYGLHQIAELPFSRSVKWRLGTERFTPTALVKDELLGAFFRRRLGPEVWGVLEPYLSATLGGPAEDVSAPAAFGRLVGLERKGGLLAGSRPLTTEGRWHLVEGMGALIEALSKHLFPKARLLPHHQVWAITRDSRSWTVHTQGGQLEAEAIIMALSAPQAAKVFRPSAPQITTLLNHFPHQHSAKVYLLCRRDELTAGPGEFFFARGEGYTSSALKLTHPNPEMTLARVQFAGETARSADSELSRLAEQDLAKCLQTRVRPLAAWVFRQPFSRPHFTQGQARRTADLERELVHAPGLFLTGSYLAGPGLANLVEHSRQTTQHALDFLALSTA